MGANRVPCKPQPVPPIFQPEVAARAIVWASCHKRRQVAVGEPTLLAEWAQKIARDWSTGIWRAPVIAASKLPMEPDDHLRPDNLSNRSPATRARTDVSIHARTRTVWRCGPSRNVPGCCSRDWASARCCGQVPGACAAAAGVECMATREADVSTDRYDLIVIGSGPGGASLAHRLAPTGKRILMLERGDYLPRARGELGRARRSSSTGRTRPKETWYGADGRSFSPRPALLRRRQFQGLRRGAVPAARARFRRGAATPAASRRPGRSAMPISSPTTRRPRQLFHVHGARGEDPTEPSAQHALSVSRRRARAAHRGAADKLSRIGLHPFHLPLGILLDEQDGVRDADQHLHTLQPSTASRACSTARPTRR